MTKTIYTHLLIALLLPACAQSKPPKPESVSPPDTASAHQLSRRPRNDHKVEFQAETIAVFATDKRRQTWLFFFRKLKTQTIVWTELHDGCGFAKAFFSNHPEVPVGRWKRGKTPSQMISELRTREISHSVRFRIVLDPRRRYTSVVDWKELEESPPNKRIDGD